MLVPLGGLVLVPSLGARPSLALASIGFSLAPVLTHLVLEFMSGSADNIVWSLALVYGALSSASLAIVTIVTMTTPVMWFPEHRGKVIGFIASGFGLASTGIIPLIDMFIILLQISVFIPLQNRYVNPNNVVPNIANSNSSSMSSYFTDPDVLEAVPELFLFMAATYGSLLSIGLALTVGPPEKEIEDGGKGNNQLFSVVFT